jgi:hypothetical protein
MDAQENSNATLPKDHLGKVFIVLPISGYAQVRYLRTGVHARRVPKTRGQSVLAGEGCGQAGEKTMKSNNQRTQPRKSASLIVNQWQSNHDSTLLSCLTYKAPRTFPFGNSHKGVPNVFGSYVVKLHNPTAGPRR